MTPTQFLEVSVSLSIQVGLLVAAAHWLCRLTSHERTHCRVWTACYLLLLVLILAAVVLPHVRMFHPWKEIGSAAAVELLNIETRLGSILFAVWFTGAVVSALLFIAGWVQVSRFLKHCKRLDLPTVSLAGGDVHNPSAAHPWNVQFLSSPMLAGPFCSQFHRPYIVLPEFLLGFQADDVRFVVRHELEHLQSGHPMQLFLQRIVEIVLWFHPLVWWASQQSELAREFACDDAAINSNADIATYLRTLLRIVERRTSPIASTPALLGFGRGKHVVAQRARRLTALAQKGSAIARDSRRNRWILPCLSALTCLIAFVWLPIDVVGSPYSKWSPWPAWSARVLYDVGGIRARDYELYGRRFDSQELQEAREKK